MNTQHTNTVVKHIIERRLWFYTV